MITLDSNAVVLMFQGRVAETDQDRSLMSFTVNDYRELFNQQLPRNLFSPNCNNTLGDASCTVNLNAFAQNGTIFAVNALNLSVQGLTRPTGYFSLGKMTFTSGVLTGWTFGISSYVLGSPQTISLNASLKVLPAIGDHFTAFAGCDRSLGANGCAKFANQANFRGFPYIPAPELAL